MKTPLRFVALLIVPTAMCTVSAVWADEANQGSNWFVGADVGVALQQDVNLKEPGFLSGAKLEFDPGVRFDVVGGYRFKGAAKAGAYELSVALEAGYIFNSVKTVAGIPLAGSGVDLDLHQFPVLANVSFTLPLKCRINPFIGGGVGGVFSVAESSGPSGFADSQGASAFGYQGFAGARYEINDRMELGVIYKFLGTTDNKFDDFKIAGTRTHTLGVSFIYRF